MNADGYQLTIVLMAAALIGVGAFLLYHFKTPKPVMAGFVAAFAVLTLWAAPIHAPYVGNPDTRAAKTEPTAPAGCTTTPTPATKAATR